MTSQETQAWNKALLPLGATLQEAIKNLDESGLQIALVVAKGNVLCGTITDGDVRRALLRGYGLQSQINDIMFGTPMVVPPEMGRDMVLHLMRANKIHQLPVVDAERRVIGLHIWDEVITPSARPNVMVIMAGGMGKRLRPFTEVCPKPMLEHIIERAKDEGFNQFVLSVHYLGHMIEEYFGDGARWQIKIDYLRENSPLGTAGALGLLAPRPELPFVVTNGDVLTDVRYGEMLDFHLHHNAMATMAIRQHEWQHPFGVVHTDGINIVEFEEKPVHRTHVNAGIYVLDPQSLNLLDQGEQCDMPTLFERLKTQGKQTIAYPMHEPWLDVGRPDDLEKANAIKPGV